ncbi:MAG: hypothetical protein PWQ79_951 [Thermococcaceae archaeon]|nr:hypothetical protein [Thermococcaceae archaeon]
MILIVPVGTIDWEILELIRKFVDDYYSGLGLRAKIGEPLPEDAFRDTYNPLRDQFLGRGFLTLLSEVRKKRGARAVLGVTSLDLYEEGLNFIFGLAHRGLGAAIISLYRLRPEFYGGLPNPELLGLRAVKEAMHELGHVFGLSHCPNVRCVMHFSNSILDTDLKSPYYCPECRRKLEENLGVVG